MNGTRVPDLSPGVEGDSSVDVIYHNMNVKSDFRTWRTTRFGDVKTEMSKLTHYVENGCFDKLISVAASKHSCVVVVATSLTREELRARRYPIQMATCELVVGAAREVVPLDLTMPIGSGSCVRSSFKKHINGCLRLAWSLLSFPSMKHRPRTSGDTALSSPIRMAKQSSEFAGLMPLESESVLA